MKRCLDCEEIKPFADFAKRSLERGTYQSRCLNCFRIYSKRHYKENGKSSDFSVKRSKRVQEIRDWYRTLRATWSCIKCGEDHPATLDCHHRDPSTKIRIGTNGRSSVSEMVAKGWSRERILEEIAKCDIICSNCHRKHHWHEKHSEDGGS